MRRPCRVVLRVPQWSAMIDDIGPGGVIATARDALFVTKVFRTLIMMYVMIR